MLLTAGGVTAAVAGQPDARPAPPPQPQTRVITVLDQPSPTTTTTTTPPPLAPVRTPPAQVSGDGAATITVIINRWSPNSLTKRAENRVKRSPECRRASPDRPEPVT